MILLILLILGNSLLVPKLNEKYVNYTNDLLYNEINGFEKENQDIKNNLTEMNRNLINMQNNYKDTVNLLNKKLTMHINKI
tara:strand:+ start:56 stop:298 length:243 start_codon:yes stop_codon:yes gene_type:complete